MDENGFHQIRGGLRLRQLSTGGTSSARASMAVPAASCSITIPSSARARRRVSTTNAELAELSPECQPVPPGYSPSFGMFQETERMVQLSLNMLSLDKEDASLGETSKDRASHETQIGALDKLASSWDFSSQRRQDFQHKFELLSRGAKRWKQKNNHRFFTPWDFSQIANAAVALSAGPASAERPGREGVSGSYFIRSRHDILGVFKPIDEESGRAETALACSPSERCLGTASGTENYFRSGGGAYREVAAYLLDHDHFARVPQTALARLDIALPASNGTENAGFQHEMIAAGAKNGAFQVYISNLGDADDFGPGVFLTESVHRIATLDIRVINCDRHGGNALVVRSERAGVSNAYELVPIDHGFVLPEFVPTCRWPVWMDWKQVKEPISARTKRYIETLDAEMDARILKDELEGCVSASSLAWLRVSTFLLKRGISLGLSLYEIGLFMFSRDPSRETSHLAKCAMEAYDAGVARERRLLSMQYDVSSTNSLTSSPSLKPKPAASLSSTVTSSRNAATSASGSSGGSQPATHFERSFSNDPIFAFDDYDIDAPVSAQHTAASAPSDGDDKQCAVGVNAPDTALNEDAELVEGGELSDAAWEYVVKYACRLLEQQLQDHERNRAAQSQRVNRESSPLGPRNGSERFIRHQSLGRVRSIPDLASVPGSRSAFTPSKIGSSCSMSPQLHRFSPDHFVFQQQHWAANGHEPRGSPVRSESPEAHEATSSRAAVVRASSTRMCGGAAAATARRIGMNFSSPLSPQRGLDARAKARAELERELQNRFNLPRLDNTLTALLDAAPQRSVSHIPGNNNHDDTSTKHAVSAKISVSPVSPSDQ